ncbi:hypothetical protein C4553_00925 [Candidatus Parcubacteria bacterium]|nr:MAG: hypothetical protein C4553_00925 [Candidatus Parcubacteria bacterium]
MKWRLKEQAPREFIHQFPEFGRLVLDLLWQREIRTQEEIDAFFNPDYSKDLNDPFLMSGMKDAVERLIGSIKNKEHVAIFGDYDVDGISGSVILATIFKKVGLSHEVYIPDRAREGYGMNIPAVEGLCKKGAGLIIVVDSGITDFEEVELANSCGSDVLIIDHHQPLERIPEAFAILNPNLKKDVYPFKHLVATGVTFKFIQALVPVLRKEGFDFGQGFEKWFLDLVALATVADMAPLIGENRILCKYGLGVLAKTSRVGIRELMNIAGVKPQTIAEPSWGEELVFESGNGNERRVRKHPITNINSQTISFSLVNRINAASRMAHAKVGFDLLMSESKEEAKDLAMQLEQKAKERVQLVRKIVEEFNLRNDVSQGPIIFAGSKDWPIGVLGIVANQLLEKHHKPTFIFEARDKESLGSIRSNKDLNIVNLLEKCGNFMTDYGGHPQSAGFRFKTENSEDLKQCLLDNIGSVVNQEPFLEIDADLTSEEIDMGLFKKLQPFEPFGVDNPTPRFLFRNLIIKEKRLIGSDKQHSKLILSGAGHKVLSIPALAFNKILPDHLRIDQRVDIVGEFMVDEFRGRLNLSIKIVDIKISEI